MESPISPLSTHEKPPRVRMMLGGARDSFTLVLAAAPFGVVYGALGQAQGLPDWVVLAISLFVFAGASQFIAVTLMAAGTALPVIVLTVFILNLRHLLYAVSLVPFVRTLPQRHLLPMAATLTDETYAVVLNRVTRHPDNHPVTWYFLGSSMFMYSIWQIGTLVGLIAGNHFPALTSYGLDMAMVVAFIGIVMPHLKLPSHWLCAITAGVAGTLTYHWPNQAGLMVSAGLAILVGMLTEHIQHKKTAGVSNG